MASEMHVAPRFFSMFVLVVVYVVSKWSPRSVLVPITTQTATDYH